MRIAIVADWLPVYGGAEHVISEFHHLWPDAPIFTTVACRSRLSALKDAEINTGPLQKIYSLIKNHRILLPLMPRAIENIDLRGYDVILSSSHAIGKGIVPPSSAVHICYCHTPMRYAWEMEEEYLSDFRVPKKIRKIIRKKLSSKRRWDLTTSKRVDMFIANSSTTQERISRIYNRESIVLLPPVDIRFFDHSLPTKRDDYMLAIGRMVPYKRFDLLINAANERGLKLLIAGKGQEESRLKKLAGPTVKFLGFVPDDKLSDLYSNAAAVIFPQLEDAGVVPLEAQACGTPVIAYGKGGVLDTVKDGQTGVLFQEQTTSSLLDAIDRFNSIKFDSEVIRNHAKQFSSEAFKNKIEEIINECNKEN